MLLWTALLCLISVNLVFSEFVPPGMLVKYDPATVLKPVKDNLESKDLSDDVHLIRGLLMARQRACPTGYGECTNPAGRCCPIGSPCCQNSGCCRPGESCCRGGGCCEPGYYCVVIDGKLGCCQNGDTCTSSPPQCATPGYIPCPREDFCCPPGHHCYRDPSNTSGCQSPTSYTPPPPPPTTAGDPMPTYATAPTPYSSSSTHRGPSTVSLPPRPPSPSQSTGSNGVTSSALSVGVNVFLTSFAGVGVFAYLF